MNGRFGGRVSMASESGSSEIDVPTASSGGPRLARVFVALKMTPEIAGELAQMALELEPFPVRLIAPADIHLTLVPPWNEVSIPEAVGKLGRVTDRFGVFTLEFRHVGYGPQPRRPRLLWPMTTERGAWREATNATTSASGMPT